MQTRFVAVAVFCAGAAYGAALGSADVAKAAERRDFAAVRTAIAAKADVNARQADGSSALLWAVHWGDVETVRALIKAGAVNGTSLEHRVYLGADGARLWERQTLLKGPGYTFPQREWPDADLVRRPKSAFDDNAPCQKRG